MSPTLGIKLVFLATACTTMVLAWLESGWARRSPRYARALALRRLHANLEALAPTRATPSACGPSTYRTAPQEPFVDLARLPMETPLPDGAVLRRYADRAEWIAESGAVSSRRRPRRAVWLGLRLVGDEVRVEARSLSSLVALLMLASVPVALASFTTASVVVVVLSVPFVLGLYGLVSLGARSDHERLAEAALVEIEHALAETDGSR